MVLCILLRSKHIVFSKAILLTENKRLYPLILLRLKLALDCTGTMECQIIAILSLTCFILLQFFFTAEVFACK